MATKAVKKRKKPLLSTKSKQATTRRVSKAVKEADEEQLRRLNAMPELATVTAVTKTEELTPTQIHYKKCRFGLCNRLVDEQGYPPYCTRVCEMFDKKRLLEISGATSQYDPKYAHEEFWAYLRTCEVSHTTRFMKIGDNLVPIKDIQVPTLAGYAMFLGLSKEVLRKWTTVHEEFRIAMVNLKQAQESFLVSKGLANVYNPKITQLLLQHSHGIKEHTEKTVNNLFGIVREAYEHADTLASGGGGEEPFDNDEEDDEENISC